MRQPGLVHHRIESHAVDAMGAKQRAGGIHDALARFGFPLGRLTHGRTPVSHDLPSYDARHFFA